MIELLVRIAVIVMGLAALVNIIAVVTDGRRHSRRWPR